MKVLAIGDPHFKVKNGKDTDLLVESVIQIIKNKDPEMIVILGDILDRHELIHQDPLKRITIFLAEVSKLKPTFLLVGNHDRPNNSVFLTDDHPFHAFQKWENLTIVDKPIIKTIDKHIFTFVPYVEPGRFIEALNTIEAKEDWNNSTAIFAHQEFKDVMMGSYVSTNGDVWPKSNPLVISGHIHEYSKMNNIIYVGTPFQQAFDESTDKAISLFTFEPKVETFENKGYKEERIKVGVPTKITLRIKVDDLNKFDIKQYDNHEIKLIIKGSMEDLKGLKKNGKIKELMQKGVKVATEAEMLYDSTVELKESGKAKKSFVDIIFELVKGEEELEKMAEEVYGVKSVVKKKVKINIKR